MIFSLTGPVTRRVIYLLAAVAGLSSPAYAADQGPRDGQPASDVLMSYDLWGNPTPVGGVTNGGSNSHSIW